MKKTWKKGDKFNATPYGVKPTIIIALKESFFKGYDFVDVDGIHWKLSEVIPYKEDNKTIKTTKKQREKLNKVIKIVENKRTFKDGAQRDSNEGKIRPDLISPYMLKALGKVLAEGAKHYGARNWEKNMPQDVFKESASRHFVSWLNDENDEDHAAKLIFNVMGFIHNRDKK